MVSLEPSMMLPHALKKQGVEGKMLRVSNSRTSSIVVTELAWKCLDLY